MESTELSLASEQVYDQLNLTGDTQTKWLYVLVLSIIALLAWRSMASTAIGNTHKSTEDPEVRFRENVFASGGTEQNAMSKPNRDMTTPREEGKGEGSMKGITPSVSANPASTRSLPSLLTATPVANSEAEDEHQVPQRKRSNINHMKLSHDLTTPGGVTILPGLIARRMATRGEGVGISLSISDLQALPKEIPEEDADPMAVLATTMLQATDLEVELSLDRPKDPGGPPQVIGSDCFPSDSEYLNQTIKQVSQGVAPMMGIKGGSSSSSKGILATTVKILDISQPDRIRLSTTFIDVGRPGSAILLPVASLPLATAGDEVYKADNQTLLTLEIGPWIPIQADSGRFIMSRWQIRRLIIVYDPSVKKKHSDILPIVLWDPIFDFVGMMQRKGADEEANTRIILVVEDHQVARGFRKRVGLLCKTLAAAEDNEAAQARLDLFKRRLFYCCEPVDAGDSRSEILPVWAKEGDPLYQHRPPCTCGVEEEEWERSGADGDVSEGSVM